MALDTAVLPALNTPVNPLVKAALTPQEQQAQSDKAAMLGAFSIRNPLVAAGADIATLPGRAIGGAYNTAARLPNAFGAELPTIPDNSGFFGGNSASMTPYYDKLRTPAADTAQAQATVQPPAQAPAPVAPTAPAVPPAVTGLPTAQSNWDKATAYAKQQADSAGGSGAVYRTSVAMAMHALSGDTAAQATESAHKTDAMKQALTEEFLKPETTTQRRDLLGQVLGHPPKWTEERDMMGQPTGGMYNTLTGERKGQPTAQGDIPEGSSTKNAAGQTLVRKNNAWQVVK